MAAGAEACRRVDHQKASALAEQFVDAARVNALLAM
jgi:hypothetical protein